MGNLSSHFRKWSEVRKEKVEVNRLYGEDGFLYLMNDPWVWILSNPVGRGSSVRSLELCSLNDRIGDCIGELSQLTHLCIGEGLYLKYLPNTISRLQNLRHLKLHSCSSLLGLPANLGDLHSLSSLTLDRCRLLKSLPNSVANLSNLTALCISYCDQLQELPANLGDLHNLTSLTYKGSPSKSLPNSVAKLSKLTTLDLSACFKLEELPANLGELEVLTTLFLDECHSLRSLPWSLAKLSMLRFLYLPMCFRLETLPPHMNDSILISVYNKHVRKTWKELKTEIKELFSIQFPIIPVELAVEAAHITSTPGYLRFMGDPRPWIQYNYGLRSSVRILDLDLRNEQFELNNGFEGNIPDSIGELPQLTHLYISHGCLQYHLPRAFTRITHLSLSLIAPLSVTLTPVLIAWEGYQTWYRYTYAEAVLEIYQNIWTFQSALDISLCATVIRSLLAI